MTKRVLITGVSSGIGLAQARLFLENNYQVYGVDQGEDPLLQGDFHFLQRDLILDLEPIFDWCPQVDVLCNTAGVLDAYKPLLEQSAQEIQEIFEINYITSNSNHHQWSGFVLAWRSLFHLLRKG